MIFPEKAVGKKDKEIVIFGKGYGESILLHLSGHKYILIDTFNNNETGNAIACDYLKSVGLSSNNIIGFVCTHWDNDHCRGLSKLIKSQCNKPDVYIPGIFDVKMIEYLLSCAANQVDSTKEISEVLRNNNVDLSPLIEGTSLFPNKMPTTKEGRAELFALSPSRVLYGKFLSKIIGKTSTNNESLLGFSPNNLSAAIVAKIGNEKLLLGADLENKRNYGWEYINKAHYSKINGATIFKIPHHGSKNGFSDKTINMLSDKPIAVITRFNVGVHPLPDDEMIKKYSERCKLFVVGKKIAKQENNSQIGLERINSIIDDGPGFVRIIQTNGSHEWVCEKYGSVEEY